MKLYTITLNDHTYNVFLKLNKYTNKRTQIQLLDVEDGSPVATATVNLPDEPMTEDEAAIKNYGENVGVLAFLRENDLISEVKRIARSGYVNIPIVKLNLDRLKE
jgi:hypothetical protein